MAYYTCVKNNPSSKAASFAERTEQLVNGSDKRSVLEVKNGVPHEINTGRSMSELSVCPHDAGVHLLVHVFQRNGCDTSSSQAADGTRHAF